MRKAILLFMSFLFLNLSATFANAGYYLLEFDSGEFTPGGGESRHITPALDYNFSAGSVPRPGVLDDYLFFNISLPNPDVDPGEPFFLDEWNLSISTPGNEPIFAEEGFYDQLRRTGTFIEDGITAGFELVGNSIGVNQVTGQFQILEAEYDAFNNIKKFNVEFIQYADGDPERFMRGRFLYNATVPEPGTILLLGSGLFGAFLKRRKI